jgi:hypothetical protein
MSLRKANPTEKPASEMTPAEWREHQRFVNEQLVAQGKEPIDWSRWQQPGPLTDEAREWALSVGRRHGLVR